MLKFHDHSKLQNEILKCDQCQESFNLYDQLRFLPCYETICSICVGKIEKKAISKRDNHMALR